MRNFTLPLLRNLRLPLTHGKVVRVKEHFKGLLSEILKQNCSLRDNNSSILRFVETDVEHRPLSVYDQFGEGDSR